MKSYLTYYFHLSQLMRLWYLSHRRPAKAQASLRIRAVSPEPSLFAHMKYGSRGNVKNQTSSPTGWLGMLAWSMSLRKKKSAIISRGGSFMYSDGDELVLINESFVPELDHKAVLQLFSDVPVDQHTRFSLVCCSIYSTVQWGPPREECY